MGESIIYKQISKVIEHIYNTSNSKYGMIWFIHCTIGQTIMAGFTIPYIKNSVVSGLDCISELSLH